MRFWSEAFAARFTNHVNGSIDYGMHFRGSAGYLAFNAITSLLN